MINTTVVSSFFIWDQIKSFHTYVIKRHVYVDHELSYLQTYQIW